MTNILDKYACVHVRDSNIIKIKLEFVYICVRDNDFTPVSTILPFYIAVVLTVWYI